MTAQSTDMTEPDLRARVNALESQSQEKGYKLLMLEEWKNSVEAWRQALESWRHQNDVSDARMDVRFTEMEKKLNSINSNTSKLVWLIVGTLILAVMGVIIKTSGLSVP